MTSSFSDNDKGCKAGVTAVYIISSHQGRSSNLSEEFYAKVQNNGIYLHPPLEQRKHP